jgi:hypothetical protein
MAPHVCRSQEVPMIIIDIIIDYTFSWFAHNLSTQDLVQIKFVLIKIILFLILIYQNNFKKNIKK